MQTVYRVEYQKTTEKIFTSIELCWQYLESKYNFILDYVLPILKSPEVIIMANGFVIKFIDLYGKYSEIEYRFYPMLVRDHL